MTQTCDPRSCSHEFITRETHECEYCSRQFTTAYNLNRHKRGNCRENVCQRCNLRFQGSEQLRQHIIQCTGRQQYQCEFCAKSFQKRISLDKHRQTHTEGCKLCGANFYKRIPLITSYPQDKQIPCYFCEEIFKSEELLQKHIKMHLEGTTNLCKLCKISFIRKRQLVKHQNERHPEEVPTPVKSARKTYDCSLCGRLFMLYRDLKKHLQIHAELGEKVFKCKICGAGYIRKSTLKMHMYKHVSREDKPKCEVCAKVFSHPYCLRAHMRIHKNLKSFSCPTCHKKFRQQGHLLRHKLSHSIAATSDEGVTKKNKSGESVTRICEICKQSFKTISELREHLLSHDDRIQNKCHQCNKRFVTKRGLRDHLNMHTGQKPYKCQQCDEAFPLQCFLRKHKQSVHNVKKTPKVNAILAENTANASPTIHPGMQNSGQLQQSVQIQAPLINPGMQSNGNFTYSNPITTTDMQTMNRTQLGVLPTSVPLQNQLQPIHNPPEMLDQARNDVTMILNPASDNVNVNPVAFTNSTGDMPTYWHLQQSNFVQYHHPTSVTAGITHVVPAIDVTGMEMSNRTNMALMPNHILSNPTVQPITMQLSVPAHTTTCNQMPNANNMSG